MDSAHTEDHASDPTSDPFPTLAEAADSEVVRLLAELVRHDTTNWGGGRSRGERACAELVADKLREVGWEPVVVAREDSPERANVVVRVPGTDPELPGILVQGHLDVVPAEPDQWSIDPFAAEIRDGYLVGRGAIDMKDACAATLATLLQWGREGVRPRRDVVAAFVADEEDKGAWGAEWLVDAHPELFSNIAVSLGESGGNCTPAVRADGSPVHLYPIACGERGTMHLRLTAHGTSGHGSRPSGDDAVTRLLDACQRLAKHPWPMHLSQVVRAQLTETAAALGQSIDLSSESGVLAGIEALGDLAGPLRWSVRASSTPTMLDAGYKVNVIPGVATAEVDVRCPPGFAEQLEATLPELIGPDVDWEFTSHQPPVEAPVDSEWLQRMREVVADFDPLGVVVPKCLGGGTDAKAFARIGIANYGFNPLGADPQNRHGSGEHGIDERIPIIPLVTGQRMLREFLETV